MGLFLSFHCYILLPRTRKYCNNKEDRIDVVGTLEGFCNVNPNGFIVSLGVSFVLAKAVVEK